MAVHIIHLDSGRVHLEEVEQGKVYNIFIFTVSKKKIINNLW